LSQSSGNPSWSAANAAASFTALSRSAVRITTSTSSVGFAPPELQKNRRAPVDCDLPHQSALAQIPTHHLEGRDDAVD
jgi:hypothetical protein